MKRILLHSILFVNFKLAGTGPYVGMLISAVEEPTGRIIEYKSSDDSTNLKSICSSIVSLTNDSLGHKLKTSSHIVVLIM